MDFNRRWNEFALEAEEHAFGFTRIADAHNRVAEERDAALRRADAAERRAAEADRQRDLMEKVYDDQLVLVPAAPVEPRGEPGQRDDGSYRDCEVIADRPWRHVEAHWNGRQMVVLAHPTDPAMAPMPEEDPHGHSCDAMGCGQSHVLFRFTPAPEPESELLTTNDERSER